MSRPWTIRKASLPVNPVKREGMLRVAVVADTHSSPHVDLGRHLEALAPDAILHAGDVGGLAVVDRLSALAPCFAVRGNIDVRASELPDAFVIDLQQPARASVRLLLVHIGLQGVRLRREISQLARAERASLVVCGHSHIPFIGRDDDLEVFNPGSAGPRRFGLPIVFGQLDWTGSEIRYSHVDCETGAGWSPRASSPPSHLAPRQG